MLQYNNKTYLQIKGCPMGSRDATLFAIIFMSYIYVEKHALKTKYVCMSDQSVLYKCYIDDAILGPFKWETFLFDRILEFFNSIAENFKFILEPRKKATWTFWTLSTYFDFLTTKDRVNSNFPVIFLTFGRGVAD